MCTLTRDTAPSASGGEAATLGDYAIGYSSTLAPIVVDDKVIVGSAGGEYGIRAFIDAYDVDTGRRVWRFYTIPGPGEPGNETWAGDSWMTGGSYGSRTSVR